MVPLPSSLPMELKKQEHKAQNGTRLKHAQTRELRSSIEDDAAVRARGTHRNRKRPKLASASRKVKECQRATAQLGKTKELHCIIALHWSCWVPKDKGLSQMPTDWPK